MSLFLSPAEVAELTGIRRGRAGKTREQLQAEQLRIMGVAFRINARGAPIVTCAAVNGSDAQEKPAAKWQPAALRAV